MDQPPELDVELSRQQLWALIDCVDAFNNMHPGFLWPEFGRAPAPAVRRKAAWWQFWAA